MLRLAADENFNNDIVRGLLRHMPGLDIVRVQDAGLSGAKDQEILAWAALEGRVLLTHDLATMARFAYERTAAGEPMSGVLEIRRSIAIGAAIDALLLTIEASVEGEWLGQVRYLSI